MGRLDDLVGAVLLDVDGVEEVPVHTGAHQHAVLHRLVGAAPHPPQLNRELRREQLGVDVLPRHAVIAEHQVAGLEAEDVVRQHLVDQQRPVGHGCERGAEGRVVDPRTDDEERCVEIDPVLIVDGAPHDRGVGVLHGQREVIQDGGESALADAVADFLAIAAAQRLHVDLEVHIGAVVPVEVVPSGVEDLDLFGSREPGAPSTRPPSLATPRRCVCRPWCGERSAIGAAVTQVRGGSAATVGAVCDSDDPEISRDDASAAARVAAREATGQVVMLSRLTSLTIRRTGCKGFDPAPVENRGV